VPDLPLDCLKTSSKPTDRGGIQIDHGWDEGEHDTETTPIHLLSRARWEQEMERYKLGSADFEINPNSDIVVIS
jgi:hypothetical protein